MKLKMTWESTIRYTYKWHKDTPRVNNGLESYLSSGGNTLQCCIYEWSIRGIRVLKDNRMNHVEYLVEAL